ncbi:MAG: ATP-binding protein [Candidatus Bipolaricaulia bacterium]
MFLFGRFSLERDGQLLGREAWRNAKTQALLKILSSERGRVFSPDELIEYLWPDGELRSAASNLRSRVAELRKILEPQLTHGEQSRYILTQRGGYLLSAESDCWIDAEEFSHCEERGRRAHGAGDFDEAIRAFEGAVALYRGEYLAEDRYEEWALQIRERFRERFVEVLSLLADALARRGQYRPALSYLERALTESPLHETLYRQMMIYAFCAGDRGRAYRAYERCRTLLERELGERPSSQTEEIFRQIRAERVPDVERVYPKPIAEAPVLPAKIRHPPFVGRQREWERLVCALERARAGLGRAVLLVGEAGVGKTRLGEEFSCWAREHAGAQTLSGRCYELESPMPLQLWVEVLRDGLSQLQRADLAGVPPSWLAELAEIVPELRRILPDLPYVTLPAEHRQYRLFETLYSILRALALRAAPLLVLVDDLQWADGSSLDFLCYLLERITNEPLLIVGAARSEELGPQHGVERVRHQGSRVGRLDEIVLHRLGEQEVQDLVKSLADEVETTGDFGGRLYRESVGNPLLATAVLQALFENGAFVREGARWRLTDPSQIALAPSAVQLLERRVKRASAAAARVLQMVACAVQIELEVLEAAWEGAPEELFAHLAELTSQGLLIERGGRYEFAHDKLREVVYKSLEEPRRIWWHRRIAQALKQVYADPVAAGLAGRLAEHYERGGRPVQALEWTFKAIGEHGRRYHVEEELQLVEQGLRLLQKLIGRLPERERLEKEFDLILERLDLQLKESQLQAAQGSLERLLALAGRLHILHQAQALHWQALWHIRAAQYSQALQCAQEAYKLSKSDPTLQAVVLDQIGLIHFRMGDYRAAWQYYHQALEIFRTCDRLKEAHAWNDCANALVKLGDYRQALEHYEASLKLYRELQEQKKASAVLNNIGATLRYLGEYQQALRHLEQSCTIDRTTGDRLGLGFSLCNLAQTYRLLGRYNEALKLSHEAYQIFSSLEDSFGQCMMHRWLGVTYRELGERERAQEHLKQALENAQAIKAHAEEGECLLELAQTLLENGEIERSLQNLHRALHLSHQLDWAYLTARVYLAWSAAYLAHHDAQNALEATQAALKLIKQHSWGGELLIRAHYLKYRALHALNRPEAVDALQTAYSELQKTANRITDDSLRHSFLNIPLHRQIAAAALTEPTQPDTINHE